MVGISADTISIGRLKYYIIHQGEGVHDYIRL
jgi:hypothetical protein